MPKGRGLPKKYAKLGFKKGWREYKKAKRKRGVSSKARTSTRKGMVRRTSRRAYKKRGNPHPKRSTMKKISIPHPSVTGLASGAVIALALDKGYAANAGTWGHHAGDSVGNYLVKGNLRGALDRLGHNASELVATSGGRKQLTTAVGMAVVGAAIRKWAGNPKLGGQKLFFRI